MTKIGQYINILLESLEKKKKLLEAILAENDRQAETVKQNGDMEQFEDTIRVKQRYIRELNSMDSGFQKIFDRIKDNLNDEKALYGEEIKKMQGLIKEITELGIRIETSEQRNKQLVESYFSYVRDRVRQSKKSIRAASDYYKSMSRNSYIDPMLLDQKK